MNGLNALETRRLFIFLENKRIFSCQILRSFNVILASLEVNLPMFASRLPKPNDSNDYRERLIYLFCNTYLTFHVFKTSFKEVMSQLLHLTQKRRQTFWLVLWFNMRKFVSCVFHSLISCTDYAFVPCRASTNHKIIYCQSTTDLLNFFTCSIYPLTPLHSLNCVL